MRAGCNSMALDFVSQIASDYLMGLCKTATLLTDRVSQTDPVSASVSLEWRVRTVSQETSG